MHNLSYENEFYLHVNIFSYKRLCTKTQFENEVQDHPEMAYSRKELLTIAETYYSILLQGGEGQ